MTPQLWIQFLTFQDWRLTHPDLTDEDAVLLYKAELQLFQNYQDEIRNQTVNRQAQLTGDLLNLSADISTILNEGGLEISRHYILLSGVYGGIGTGLAVNRGSGDNRFFGIRKGDRFIFDFILPPLYTESDAGTYKALMDIPVLTGLSDNLMTLQIVLFLNELTLKTGTGSGAKLNTARFKKISNSTTLRASWNPVTRKDLNPF